jgi:hypothetical protein
MRTIHYAMHFRGRISASDSKLLRTTGSATSCTVRTTVLPSGLEADVSASPGDLAFLDSELLVTGSGSFRKEGVVMLGDENEHQFRFSTLGEGHLAPCAQPGIITGTVSCSVDGGEGQFADASGLITSTFTLSESGELNEFQSGLIFLPELMEQRREYAAEEREIWDNRQQDQRRKASSFRGTNGTPL